MAKDLQRLRNIYDRTDGYCHLCHRKLSFQNHGIHGAKGAWHVEHSVARFNGGTDRLNNLYPACIRCNIVKGTLATRTARSQNGVTRAPFRRERKEQIKEGNITAGMLIGGLVGAIGGPWGVAIGATIGGMIGHENSPRV